MLVEKLIIKMPNKSNILTRCFLCESARIAAFSAQRLTSAVTGKAVVDSSGSGRSKDVVQFRHKKIAKREIGVCI